MSGEPLILTIELQLCLVFASTLAYIPARVPFALGRDGCSDWCPAKADAPRERLHHDERLWVEQTQGEAGSQHESSPDGIDAAAACYARAGYCRVLWG